MSNHSATAHDAHGHGDHGHDDHDDGASHSTFGGYMTGFVLAVILTAIPFWLVMGKVFQSSSTTALILLGLGAIQIVVHMIYFLHMNARSEGGWNMLALMFTLVLVVITLAGSLWVMYHMNVNMMPHMNMHDMQGMS
ncbi:cytochrome o ubiquinol oxidase subunit IV [Bordetella genomosp. 10]|uniref:Cytochrome bo(3) ubiquinol oxidase subunit 4 n=1 Tax=Bordetella genomosp. 10 TaxID=1416804 RepID=A0A261SMM8_9BORD|nr:cytochrome o ubiquinol oxidase subunit IV [Bordetella genomosp. 10]OZI38020.1 cytochrome o ubiquinol oxidase subunit IV [Bordetella genomosp. 10]